jgi:glyoxylase-like metal-dependent hydrolase (beta-lactamase superfamily II)
MRVFALHPDVLVATSAIWQTNCVVVRGGDETFVVDSPVLPGELDSLPALLEQAQFSAPSGLLATHGDWDHLLGPLAFPQTALGCAQSTAERMRAAPGEAQRELRSFDEQYLIERPRPLALSAMQALPVPGRCGLGELELELHPTAGHTQDGMAIWVPWARVLLAGDYLSSVEIPTLSEISKANKHVEGSLGPDKQVEDGSGPDKHVEDSSGPDKHVEGGLGPDKHVEGSLGPDKQVEDGSGPDKHAESSLEAYLATLARLRPLVAGAERVVPGHGPVLDSAETLAVLEEDLAYLNALGERGAEAALPAKRRSAYQRGLHAENLARVRS